MGVAPIGKRAFLSIMEHGLSYRGGDGLTKLGCEYAVVLKHFQVPMESFKTSARVSQQGLIIVVELLVQVNPSRSAYDALLRTSESVLLHPGLEGFLKGVRWAGFGEKAENLSLIDGLHYGVQVIISGQHHPHGVWCSLANKIKELDPIEARHATIGYHHCKRSPNSEYGEPLFSS